MVAGEASGDFLGAHLIAALRKRIPGLKFVGIGGPKMEAEGLDSWFPMEKLAVRGYVEVLRHFLELHAIRRKLRRRLLAAGARVFVGTGTPHFQFGPQPQVERGGNSGGP